MVVEHLLPTPMAADSTGRNSTHLWPAIGPALIDAVTWAATLPPSPGGNGSSAGQLQLPLTTGDG
jgi:hypothetical protein